MKKSIFIINIILLVLWMGLIFNFSNDNGDNSSRKSERLIITVTEKINNKKMTNEEKEKILDKYSIPVRKIAHMFLYYILGLLSFLLLYQLYGLKPVTVIYTLIFCLIYAITDELHQLFIIERSSEFKDILIDTCGSFIFLIIPIIILLKRKKNINKSS